MDKTDNFILSIKYCYFIPVLLYFAIQPLKSEPDKFLIISQVLLNKTKHCYKNTFPKIVSRCV